MKSTTRLFFLFTLLFFGLGFINIHFAILGLLCMSLPVYLLIRDRKKTWCQSYCPRAKLYTTIGRSKPYSHRPTPKFFINGGMKKIMLVYFGINLFIMVMSTIMVGVGKAAPMDHLRFLFFLRLPGLPQLLLFQSTG